MKTNRDLFANVFFFVWLSSNVAVYLITRDNGYVLLSTYSFLFIMALIVVCSRKSRKFNDWLDKRIKKRLKTMLRH